MLLYEWERWLWLMLQCLSWRAHNSGSERGERLWHGGMLDQCPGLPWAAGAPLKLATLSFTSKLVPRLQTLSIFYSPRHCRIIFVRDCILCLSSPPPSVSGSILVTKWWVQCYVARLAIGLAMHRLRVRPRAAIDRALARMT